MITSASCKTRNTWQIIVRSRALTPYGDAGPPQHQQELINGQAHQGLALFFTRGWSDHTDLIRKERLDRPSMPVNDLLP